MKKLFFTATAVLLSLYGYGQTQGTSAVSLGISSGTQENNYNPSVADQTNKFSYANFRLGYGLFVKDNNKVGLDLIYNRVRNNGIGAYDSREDNGYGAAINYQRYFPLLKTFYAFAGGSAQYIHSKAEIHVPDAVNRNSFADSYSLTANGGLSWFFTKRWALETTLISTGLFYTKTEADETAQDQSYSSKNTSFSLSTDGLFNNLGFKVYFMF